MASADGAEEVSFTFVYYETDSATASAANRAQAGGGARPGGAPDWSAATRASTVGCVRSQRDGPSSLLKYACA